MAKILLISPPWSRFFGVGFNEIPVGLCYLSSTLEQKGHKTAVLNCDLITRGNEGSVKIFAEYKQYKSEFKEFKDPIWNQIKLEIEKFKPDYVGIHTKTAAIKSVLKVAEITKAVNPNIFVVVGGIHATLVPEKMAVMPNIDFVIQGEGEETLKEFIKLNEHNNIFPIPGLIYKKGNKILNGGLREPIKDIDSIPFPDRENLIYKKQYSSYSFGIIITSRGCPHRCTYCAAKKMWPGPVRYRNVDSIINEIKYVKEKFGTKYFNFRDDTFTLNKKRAIEICQRIIEEKLRIVWRCDTRADSLDEELVRIMKLSGCVQINIGIESGSDRILKLVKKGETTKDIKQGIMLVRKYGIPISAFIMVGFPTETKEEAFNTIRFAKSLKVNTLVLSIVTPYPGTEIRDLFKNQGVNVDEIDFSDFYHQSPKMGLVNLEGENYYIFLKNCFNEVKRYNTNPIRLLNRFIIIFVRNPRGAIEKALNYFYK